MRKALALPEIKLFKEPGTGIVEETIAPKQPGRIRYRATYWPARFYNGDFKATLVPNDSVCVIGREGLTLLVIPLSERAA